MPVSTPDADGRIDTPLRLLWVAAAVFLAVDLAIAVVAGVDAGAVTSAGVVLVDAVVMATGPALLTGVRWLLPRRRGRGRAALLVAVGMIGATYLLLLMGVGQRTPVCDYGGGDACAFASSATPLPYAGPRTACILVVATATVAVLTRFGRVEPGRAGPVRTPALASLAISTICGLAITVVNLPATAQRLATATADSQSLIDGAARDGYAAAGWIGGTAVVLAAGLVLLGLLIRRSTPRRQGASRVLGGLFIVGQVAWTGAALVLNPVGWKLPNRFHLVDAPLPSWYPPTLATLVVLALIATLVGACLLLVGGRRRPA